MSGTTAEIAAGGAVLALAAGFVVYAGQMTGFGDGGGDRYHLTASFRSVEGISVGSDVRLGGVKVGTVTDLALNPETYRADATFSVQEPLRLPDDSSVLISSEGLLGGNYVELQPGGSPFNYEPGAQILDTQSPVSLVTLLMRFVGGSDEGEATSAP